MAARCCARASCRATCCAARSASARCSPGSGRSATCRCRRRSRCRIRRRCSSPSPRCSGSANTCARRRWAAVIIGFIGVLVIVRPGTDAFTAGSLVAVLAAVLSAIVAIQIKQLSRVDPGRTRSFSTPTCSGCRCRWCLRCSCGSGRRAYDWLWLAVHRDIRHRRPAAVDARAAAGRRVRADADQLHAAAAGRGAGWLLFDEQISRWTVIGAAIIFVANAYIAHREAQLSRHAETSAPIEAAKPGE